MCLSTVVIVEKNVSDQSPDAEQADVGDDSRTRSSFLCILVYIPWLAYDNNMCCLGCLEWAEQNGILCDMVNGHI